MFMEKPIRAEGCRMVLPHFRNLPLTFPLVAVRAKPGLFYVPPLVVVRPQMLKEPGVASRYLTCRKCSVMVFFVRPGPCLAASLDNHARWLWATHPLQNCRQK